ncbi:MAG: DUF167 domain-containing protein [Prosthecobacter sp.]
MTDRVQLVVRVTPNARRSEILGWGADEKGRSVLMIKLAAPPVDGKANTELLRFMADLFDCAKGQVQLLRGEGSRQKVLEVPADSLEKLPSR